MKHILLTGGSGFIGPNFVRLVFAQRPGVKVTNLDALTYSGNPENLSDLEGDSRYKFVKGDICDAPLMEKLIGDCDAVVHMAAESHVDRSILDAGPFIKANTVGTQILLDVLRRMQVAKKAVPRFLYVSTDEVYGTLPLEDKSQLFREDTPLQPNSPYSASKAGGDCLVRAYFHTYGLPVLTTNSAPSALPLASKRRATMALPLPSWPALVHTTTWLPAASEATA